MLGRPRPLSHARPREAGQGSPALAPGTLPLRRASGGLGKQWPSCCCCPDVLRHAGTAIWARGPREWPAGHLPAWSWLLPKGSRVSARAGAAGRGPEAVLWPGQPFRPQAACRGEAWSPQLPVLVLPLTPPRAPEPGNLAYSTSHCKGFRLLSGSPRAPWLQVFHLYSGQPGLQGPRLLSTQCCL